MQLAYVSFRNFYKMCHSMVGGVNPNPPCVFYCIFLLIDNIKIEIVKKKKKKQFRSIPA